MAANDRIAAYTRISVDDELDNKNISIENQKSIIADYIAAHFPDTPADYYEDRDKSGYTFDWRPGYQEMRKLLFSGYYTILIIKDFSRFSRRNSLGLLELEHLRDAGIRIIAIADSIDYPTNDDWLSIQLRFLMNERPVTESSKKVRDVIANRQKNAEWICNVPYGYYLHPYKKNTVCIDKEGAEVVRIIFDLYNQGYGYKKIARYLTEHHYPTGKALIKKQLDDKDADSSKVVPNPVWSPVSVAKILSNDFYIGTLRQKVWTRAGINKKDVRVDAKDQYVFENHHEPILSREVFEKAQEIAAQRGHVHYKGVKKYPNPYVGRLFCADCGAPMFTTSNPKRPHGYVCGTYHRRGLEGCTSHHIHRSTLDAAVKSYITTVRDNLQSEIVGLDVAYSKEKIEQNKQTVARLRQTLADYKSELAESSRQRIRQIARNPQNEELLTQTYDALDSELLAKIALTEEQIGYLEEDSQKKKEVKKNIERILDMFRLLLDKEEFTQEDIGMMIEKITVDSDKVVTVFLKSSITELFDIVQGTKA